MCKQMYEGENAARNEAEKVLVSFQNSLDALPKCQLLLDRGESSYSQLLAATTLTKLIAKNAQGLSLQEIVDIRNYILNYLATRPNLESFVVQSLVTVLAKITKYGWFYCHKDEMVFRNIIEDVRNFLQVTIAIPSGIFTNSNEFRSDHSNEFRNEFKTNQNILCFDRAQWSIV